MHKFFVSGLVQGVGFRPYIYNACVARKLRGYVMNVGNGVVIVADHKSVLEEILASPPPRARIDHTTITDTNETCVGFEIRASLGEGFAEIPSDSFMCAACLRELEDATDRRSGYFFTTCTHCGPRFTIAKKAPYDRHTTSMADFPMCDRCTEEYTDPTNRRYHAQTIACHACGPRMSLYHNAVLETSGTGRDIIEQTAQLLQSGEVVAVKGVGGFHLACTTQPSTVQKLKAVTERNDKPFALLCKDLATVSRIAHVSEEQKILLESPERPIVLLEKTSDLTEVTELSSVGVMLPSTALHYLLFEVLDEPLVMTSSNLAGEPITKDRSQQFVPWVLDHDRTIENVADDSLIKVIQSAPLYIRRSRGFVPRSIQTPTAPDQHILACGAEMHNTFALYKDGTITPSQYLGNTTSPGAFAHYKDTVEKFMQYTHTRPTLVCTDLHPDFNTTRFGIAYAEEAGIPHIAVQHHKAHAYSIALEHDLTDFTAIICDGVGYGDDGTLWGGEVFHNDKRIGHLEQHLQLGGDSATQHPAKMTYAILRTFLSATDTASILGDQFTQEAYTLLNAQWEKKIHTQLTSSCGRVLDAAAALLGVCTERTYDGRPAMLLESFSTTPYPLEPVIDDTVLMTTPLFSFLVENLDKDRARLAATVEQYLAQGLYTIAQTDKRPILFGGGCAYNNRMTSYMLEHGVYVNKNIPAGDGGISVGQIGYVSANARNNVS